MPNIHKTIEQLSLNAGGPGSGRHTHEVYRKYHGTFDKVVSKHPSEEDAKRIAKGKNSRLSRGDDSQSFHVRRIKV